jgi:hypothetical protein
MPHDFYTFDVWILLAFSLEALLLMALIPTLLKVSQWNRTLQRESTPWLLALRQQRRDIKALKEDIEHIEGLYALPFFKYWRRHPLRWILTRWMPR